MNTKKSDSESQPHIETNMDTLLDNSTVVLPIKNEGSVNRTPWGVITNDVVVPDLTQVMHEDEAENALRELKLQKIREEEKLSIQLAEKLHETIQFEIDCEDVVKESTMWACTACTFLNKPLSLTCQICQTERVIEDGIDVEQLKNIHFEERADNCSDDEIVLEYIDSSSKDYHGVAQCRDIPKTKHNAVDCGIKNNKRLEESSHTGDIELYQHTGNMGNTHKTHKKEIILPNKVYNSLKSHYQKRRKKGIAAHGKIEKSTRATEETVLDKSTKMTLFKWVSNGMLSEVYGCIRTGKEASVYHAVSHSSKLHDDICPINGTMNEESNEQNSIHQYAIKIFKTTMTDFTNRAEYVTGDFRFKDCKFSKQKNTRKLCKIWCEKEMKNLIRIYRKQIPCPRPIQLSDHILLMELITEVNGNNISPAPQLREAISLFHLSSKQLGRVFRKCAILMRNLFIRCNLVHADLSEYNLLLQKIQPKIKVGEKKKGKSSYKLYVIDVGQAVDTSHPRATEFLRRDVKTIIDFFSKVGKSITTLTYPQLYTFVTDSNPNAFTQCFDGKKQTTEKVMSEPCCISPLEADINADHILKSWLSSDKAQTMNDLTDDGLWQHMAFEDQISSQMNFHNK